MCLINQQMLKSLEIPPGKTWSSLLITIFRYNLILLPHQGRELAELKSKHDLHHKLVLVAKAYSCWKTQNCKYGPDDLLNKSQLSKPNNTLQMKRVVGDDFRLAQKTQIISPKKSFLNQEKFSTISRVFLMRIVLFCLKKANRLETVSTLWK